MLGSRPATRPGFVVDSGASASSGDSPPPLTGPVGDEVEPEGTQLSDEQLDAEPMDTTPDDDVVPLQIAPDAEPLQAAPDAEPLQAAPDAEPLQAAPDAELRNEPASDIIQIG